MGRVLAALTMVFVIQACRSYGVHHPSNYNVKMGIQPTQIQGRGGVLRAFDLVLDPQDDFEITLGPAEKSRCWIRKDAQLKQILICTEPDCSGPHVHQFSYGEPFYYKRLSRKPLREIYENFYQDGDGLEHWRQLATSLKGKCGQDVGKMDLPPIVLKTSLETVDHPDFGWAKIAVVYECPPPSKRVGKYKRSISCSQLSRVLTPDRQRPSQGEDLLPE